MGDAHSTAAAAGEGGDSHRSHPRAPLAYRALAPVLIPLFRVLFRPRVSGREQLPAGGFVLCANQLSNMDSFVLGAVLYPRWVRFMGKAEVFNAVLGPFLRACGSFPVDRGRRDLSALETAATLAREGHPVAIFPEGTRRAKGLRKSRVATPHRGAAHAALLAGVPVVPAAIRGTEALTRLRRWRVAIGEPIAAADLAGLSPRAARRELTERLWARVLELEARLDEPGGWTGEHL